MEDRTAASGGFVFAGIGLAAALGIGQPAPILVAGLALVGFGLRRYEIGDTRVSLVAGVIAIVLAVVAANVALSGAEDVGHLRTAAGVAVVAGLLAAVAGYADWREIPRERLSRMIGTAAVATAIGISGLIAIVAWSVVIGSVIRAVTPGDLDLATMTTLSTLALGLGTGTIAALYLVVTDRDLDFIDIRWPGLRDAAYALGGVVAIVGLNLGIGALFRWLGLESATHSVVRAAESDPGILLVLIPLSYLVIGPGEEVLYRNIVQKSLYGTFSRGGAIVVASAIFAGAHLFAFADPNGSLLATVTTLVVVFALSLVLGVVYERTGNIAVPAFVHGSFDAIAFAVTYVQLTGLAG